MKHCTQCAQGQGRDCKCPQPLDLILLRLTFAGLAIVWAILGLILTGVIQ